jgi:hypothetical protein
MFKGILIAVALLCSCTDSRAVVWPEEVQDRLDQLYDQRQRERLEDRSHERRREMIERRQWEEMQDHIWDTEDYYDDE